MCVTSGGTLKQSVRNWAYFYCGSFSIVPLKVYLEQTELTSEMASIPKKFCQGLNRKKGKFRVLRSKLELSDDSKISLSPLSRYELRKSVCTCIYMCCMSV